MLTSLALALRLPRVLLLNMLLGPLPLLLNTVLPRLVMLWLRLDKLLLTL
jgi:hypothetical protein